jgi:hypothetical protein
MYLRVNKRMRLAGAYGTVVFSLLLDSVLLAGSPTDFRGYYVSGQECTPSVKCVYLRFVPQAPDVFIGMTSRRDSGDGRSGYIQIWPVTAAAPPPEHPLPGPSVIVFRAAVECSSDSCVQVKVNLFRSGMPVLVRVAKRIVDGKTQPFVLIEPIPGG